MLQASAGASADRRDPSGSGAHGSSASPQACFFYDHARAKRHVTWHSLSFLRPARPPLLVLCAGEGRGGRARVLVLAAVFAALAREGHQTGAGSGGLPPLPVVHTHGAPRRVVYVHVLPVGAHCSPFRIHRSPISVPPLMTQTFEPGFRVKREFYNCKNV